MKFYMTPGSCSTGIHILLEELDKVFEAYIVNLPAGEQYTPEYTAINPKSTIPTLLRDDGTSLTEFQAIAYWLARSNPKAGLLPEDLQNGVTVEEIIYENGLFKLISTDGPYTANKVVIACGSYHYPKIPVMAGSLPNDICQLHAAGYKNPAQLPEGGNSTKLLL